MNLLLINIPVFGYQKFQVIVLEYNNPVNLLNALALFILFARHQFSQVSSRIALRLGGLVFAAYLLQTNKVVFRAIRHNFVWIGKLSLPTMIIAVIGASFSFLIAGMVIEFLRIRLMKLFHAERISLRISSYFQQNLMKFLGNKDDLKQK